MFQMVHYDHALKEYLDKYFKDKGRSQIKCHREAFLTFIFEKFPQLPGIFRRLNFQLETGTYQFWSDETNWELLGKSLKFLDEAEKKKYKDYMLMLDNIPKVRQF